jgi:probable rRNA maturation factor
MTVSVNIINHVKNSGHYHAEEKLISTWSEATLRHLKVNQHQHQDLSIILADQELSAKLNQQFRQKKGPTNILSFNYDAINEDKTRHLGELVICLEVTEKEAAELNISNEEHWAHLIIHGVLHLLGYDHISEHETVTMESLEIEILNQLGYDNPYR